MTTTAAALDGARLATRDGGARTLRPKHIVLATSVSGTPNIPAIDGIDEFQGPGAAFQPVHAPAREWAGRPWSCSAPAPARMTSARSCRPTAPIVTMVQRSPTMVVNVEPAQLYDKTYLGDGPPIDVARHPQFRRAAAGDEDRAQDHHRRGEAIDAPLLSRLEQAGFRLEFGEDGTGWPLKFRTRGGGYYFNVGCSELIADGKIRLIQAADIAHFDAGGLHLKDGSTLQADLVRARDRLQGASITCSVSCSALMSPSASAASGALTSDERAAQHVDAHRRSPACGSPAARSRRPASTAASSRCRSTRSSAGCSTRRRCNIAETTPWG